MSGGKVRSQDRKSVGTIGLAELTEISLIE